MKLAMRYVGVLKPKVMGKNVHVTMGLGEFVFECLSVNHAETLLKVIVSCSGQGSFYITAGEDLILDVSNKPGAAT